MKKLIKNILLGLIFTVIPIFSYSQSWSIDTTVRSGLTKIGNHLQVNGNSKIYGDLEVNGNINGGDIGIPSGVKGDILYHNGTDWVVLSPDITGRFLQTNGIGADPSWEAASGSGDVSFTDTLPGGTIATKTETDIINTNFDTVYQKTSGINYNSTSTSVNVNDTVNSNINKLNYLTKKDLGYINVDGAYFRSNTSLFYLGIGRLVGLESQYCTYMGDETGRYNTNIKVTAFGTQAARRSEGERKVAFGDFTCEADTGSDNTAVGYNALADHYGDYVNAMGVSSGIDAISSRSNYYGYTAGQFSIGDRLDFFGYNAGNSCIIGDVGGVGNNIFAYNTGAYSYAVGGIFGRMNNGTNLTGSGYRSAEYNDGDNNTVVGTQAFNTFSLDAGNSQTFASTAITVVGDTITITSHGFGTTGEYVNLQWSTDGTLPSGVPTNQKDNFLIVDANTLKLRSDDMLSQGTGNHTLTPQFVYTNSTAIGFNAEPSASNQIKLGDLLVTEVKTSGSVNTTGSYQVSDVDRIDSGGYFMPVSSTDASAPNNSIYYSTTQNKLVYKDSGGTVNLLY